MAKPLSSDNKELDATFYVKSNNSGFNVVFESRSGGDPGRNTDYQRAVIVVLARMAERGMILRSAQIASKKVQDLPETERILKLDNYAYPVPLANVPIVDLQQSIGRALQIFGRLKPEGGNATKRLMLEIISPTTLDLPATEIEEMIAGRASIASFSNIWTEEPSDDPDEITKRVLFVRRKLKQIRPLTPPPNGVDEVKRKTVISERFIRDPNVIAWILENALGNCEICNMPAPFVTDDGNAYLEVHHVLPVARGGPDKTDNAVASCANCHRRLHYSSDRETIRKSTIAKIARLGSGSCAAIVITIGSNNEYYF